MGTYLLSVDNGGTYIKAALFDVKGNQIGISRHYNQVVRPCEGWAEYDMKSLWETNCRCMREVIERTDIDPQRIACIGFAGQGKGLYPVDVEGNPVRNGITSSDVRAQSYVDKWMNDGTSERLYGTTFQNASSGQPVSILRWMKDNEPKKYARIRWVFSMKDFLFYRLTGKAIAGKGTQSGTCMVDLTTQEYEPELLKAYGIPEMEDKLPQMKWDTELCGTVSEEAAHLCGCVAGTPVSAGMFDVDASAIAIGVIDTNCVFIITGTHGINGYISSKPVTNGTIGLNSLYSLPGMYLIEEGYPSSSGTLEWVISVLFDDEGENAATLYTKINRMVEEIEPDQSKLVFLPFLHGWRDSIVARGTWIGLCPEHTKGHMLRAVYEGVVFTHMLQTEHLFMNRVRPPKILMAGGATNSEPWMQMFADALQIPMQIVKNNEMGAKGVAIASTVAVNIYPDIRAAVEAMTHESRIVAPRRRYAEIYTRKFVNFKDIVSKLNFVWQNFV
jgi:L-xylulokinase